MSDIRDIRSYYKAIRDGNPRPDFGLAYTCNCGWIDAGHTAPTNAKGLWQQILNEKEKYQQNGIKN